MTASETLALAVYGFLPRAKFVEEAGLSYEVSLVRDKLTLRKDTLPVFKNVELETSPSPDEEDADRSKLYDNEGEKYWKYLTKLNPNDTKNQDHYKVLGLSKLRWQATMADIRTCYRRKVLKHHPDKKKHRGETLPNGSEEYFTCITKAYEQLGMSESKRLAYDSVDHKFDDTIPTEKSINKDNFFKELAPIFEINARWSSKKPVPSLGKLDAPRDDVIEFYNFWFDFQSWREFSYLDEEDKERGEDRYERREMEKQNKAERERRRKEEVKRIRKLVEMAYGKDPRVVRIKREEKEAKDKKKEEKQRVLREKQEAVEREKREKEEAERLAKEEEQKRLKEEKEREKKEKELLKKAANAQRRRLKKLADEAGHWAESGEDKLREMERIERICFTLSTDAIADLCDNIELLSVEDEVRSAIEEAEINHKTFGSKKNIVKVEDKSKDIEKAATWSNEEIQLLVKASNTFPAGTVDRWIQIADYINEHRKDKSLPPKNEKQVIKQSKAVQGMAVKLPSTTQNTLGTALPDEDVWTPDEQKLLEAALKKIPSSDPDRFDKISTEVGTKSKKACIRRVKYLVQKIKNKK
ncbi:unnamed protein product [Auanema sp. JU1783]|nr:unnamed protein product [Auanema sp. JU1783]